MQTFPFIKVFVAHEKNDAGSNIGEGKNEYASDLLPSESDIDALISETFNQEPSPIIRVDVVWYEHYIRIDTIHHFTFYPANHPLNDVGVDVTVIWEYGHVFWLKMNEAEFKSAVGFQPVRKV